MNQYKKVLYQYKKVLVVQNIVTRKYRIATSKKAIKSFEVDVRSSHPEVFCKKGVLEIFQNSQENTYGRNIF